MKEWFKGFLGGHRAPEKASPQVVRKVPAGPVRSAQQARGTAAPREQAREQARGEAGRREPPKASVADAKMAQFGRDESRPSSRPASRPSVQREDMVAAVPATGAAVPPPIVQSAKAGTSLVPIQPGRRVSVLPTLADAETVENLLVWTGDIITAPTGSVPLTDNQRKYVAMLGDGRLLIAKEYEMTNDVLQATQILKGQGKVPVTTLVVEMEIIRVLYANALKALQRNSGRRTRNEGLQEMQKQVLELIQHAASMGSSDIHLRVRQYTAEIWIRTDGVLQKDKQIDSDIALDICNAAFNMADASDPTYLIGAYQGARIAAIGDRTSLPEGVGSVRLQFSPLGTQQRLMVARLLYANSKAVVGADVDTLGYSFIHVNQIKKMRRKPYGINIISGPTGSGKSTTLQRALSALLHEKAFTISVITVEDPPEYIIEGTVQLPVINAKTEADRRAAFTQALSAALRSDPDVVMIGEIRDGASASLAFAAAMTGHGVWASLHANDALSILGRLRDMDVDMYKLTDPTLMTGLIGQRLVRRLCEHCSVPFNKACSEQLISSELAARLVAMVGQERAQSARASSGRNCGQKGCREGYMGRDVVAEAINPNSKFMEFVRKDDKEGARQYWLTDMNGMTIPEHGLQKVIDGRVSPADMEEKLGDIDDLDPKRMEKVFGVLYRKE